MAPRDTLRAAGTIVSAQILSAQVMHRQLSAMAGGKAPSEAIFAPVVL